MKALDFSDYNAASKDAEGGLCPPEGYTTPASRLFMRVTGMRFVAVNDDGNRQTGVYSGPAGVVLIRTAGAAFVDTGDVIVARNLDHAREQLAGVIDAADEEALARAALLLPAPVSPKPVASPANGGA